MTIAPTTYQPRRRGLRTTGPDSAALSGIFLPALSFPSELLHELRSGFRRTLFKFTKPFGRQVSFWKELGLSCSSPAPPVSLAKPRHDSPCGVAVKWSYGEERHDHQEDVQLGKYEQHWPGNQPHDRTRHRLERVADGEGGQEHQYLCCDSAPCNDDPVAP